MNVILIKKNEYDEFEVPTTSDSEIYFTDDKQDATDTAMFFHGAEVVVLFRRGTYDKGENA
ncbi:MAG: hypothetical protein E4G74_02140 [Erysipelotrichales bacterium]|jgi:hypothetical protein|nr:MAG: hypothetical protein E4G74_02140 [Erysipelotrichales bacterium]